MSFLPQNTRLGQLEHLETFRLHKIVYVPMAVTPFWGYLEKLDIHLRLQFSSRSLTPGERRHLVYPAIGWKSQQTLKVLRKDVNILPNRFTVDRDIWNVKI
jgi:hypothetical protein